MSVTPTSRSMTALLLLAAEALLLSVPLVVIDIAMGTAPWQK